MPSRRTVIACLAALPGAALAQNASPGSLIGEWQGEVDGIGAARIVISGVRPDGKVEGRMEFALHSFVSTFADKADPGDAKTNLGIASGQTLTIESALGGTYDLVCDGNTLKGTYTRGTTFKGPASFSRR